MNYLQNEGTKITLLPVDSGGVVDLETLEKTIKKETILISVVSANN